MQKVTEYKIPPSFGLNIDAFIEHLKNRKMFLLENRLELSDKLVKNLELQIKLYKKQCNKK